MKKTTFEMLLIAISAPLAGIGMAMLTNGSVGGAFILLGASLKLIVAYFRTPKDMFDWDGFTGNFDDFRQKMEKIQDELENEKPLLGWLSNLGTYMMLGGLVALLLLSM